MQKGMKIKIGYRNYLVIWGYTSEYGECDKSSGVIWISDKMPLEEQACTLMHEIMHACWEHMNLKPRVDEETAVDGLSRAFSMVLLDNPDMLYWLAEALNGDD
jgi:uncharacterized protein YjaZ